MGYLARYPRAFRALVAAGSLIAVALAAGDGKWG